MEGPEDKVGVDAGAGTIGWFQKQLGGVAGRLTGQVTNQSGVGAGLLRAILPQASQKLGEPDPRFIDFEKSKSSFNSEGETRFKNFPTIREKFQVGEPTARPTIRERFQAGESTIMPTVREKFQAGLTKVSEGIASVGKSEAVAATPAAEAERSLVATPQTVASVVSTSPTASTVSTAPAVATPISAGVAFTEASNPASTATKPSQTTALDAAILSAKGVDPEREALLKRARDFVSGPAP